MAGQIKVGKVGTITCAMDWVRKHGCDFWAQFSSRIWALAVIACDYQRERRSNGHQCADSTAARYVCALYDDGIDTDRVCADAQLLLRY